MGQIFDTIMNRANEIYGEIINFNNDLEIYDMTDEISKLRDMAKKLEDDKINEIEKKYDKKFKELYNSRLSRIEEERQRIFDSSDELISLNDAIAYANTDHDEIENQEIKKLINRLYNG